MLSPKLRITCPDTSGTSYNFYFSYCFGEQEYGGEAGQNISILFCITSLDGIVDFKTGDSARK
jgi:hypothetical protein